MSPSVVHEVREDHSERDDRDDQLENEYGLLTRRHLLERQLLLRRRRTPLRSLLWVAHLGLLKFEKTEGKRQRAGMPAAGVSRPPRASGSVAGGTSEYLSPA